MTSNPTNTQEDELDAQLDEIPLDHDENCFEQMIRKDNDECLCGAKQALSTLISNQREQARQELLDELEKSLPKFIEDEAHDKFIHKAVRAWDVTTNFIQSKRATLPKREEK